MGEETGLEAQERSLERRIGGAEEKRESGSFGVDDGVARMVGVGRRAMEEEVEMKVMMGLIWKD